MKLIDISPLLSERTAVWPGDVPFSRCVSMDLNNGDPMTLSSINSTVHVGAHVDAPNHYQANADGIAAQPLQRYYGSCQVIAVQLPPSKCIQVQDLQVPISAPRVLFRTCSFPNPENWNSDFNALSVELVHFLFAHGVELVGIDTPSVDLYEDKRLPCHQAAARNDMTILEGLVLAHVQAGEYTLCALPLRMESADASPVRAVLVTD